MSASDEKSIMAEAAEWLTKLDGADAATRAAFVTWSKTSPRHFEEFIRTAELVSAVSRLGLHLGSSPSKKVAIPTTDRTEEPGIEPRTIYKYPERRLYDTAESRYITLADIRRLVIDRVDFVVMDKKTQEDITRSILLQVIAEQEHGGEHLMSRDFLSQIIRSYGGTMQGVIGSYLEQSLKLFASQQRDARERIKSVGDPESAEAVNHLAQRNYQRWRSVQDEIYRTLMNEAARGRSEVENSPTTVGPARAPR